MVNHSFKITQTLVWKNLHMPLRTQKNKNTNRPTCINVPLKGTAPLKLKLLNRQTYLQYYIIYQHFLPIFFKQDIETSEKQLNQL